MMIDSAVVEKLKGLSWSEAFNQLQPEAQAYLISMAWRHASVHGSPAMLSNMLHNSLHPTGICCLFDSSGITIAEVIRARSE